MAARGARAEAAPGESIYKLVTEGKRSAGERASVYGGPTKPAVPKRPEPRSPNGKPRAPPHRDSSQVAQLINPGPSRPKQAHNHARDNLIAVREASSRNQLKKLVDQDGGPRAGKRPAGYVPRSVTRTPSAPAETLGERDFVRENAVDAGAAATGAARARKTEPAPAPDFRQKENYGKVPAYLQERKVELANAAARRKALEEAEAIRPGMRLMPEDERVQTLGLLQRSRAETEKALQAMPFTIETPSQIRKKADLEKRLQEIEEAEHAFSRKKVFVRA